MSRHRSQTLPFFVELLEEMKRAGGGGGGGDQSGQHEIAESRQQRLKSVNQIMVSAERRQFCPKITWILTMNISAVGEEACEYLANVNCCNQVFIFFCSIKTLTLTRLGTVFG